MRFLSPEFLFTLAPNSRVGNPETITFSNEMPELAKTFSGDIEVEKPIKQGTLVLEEDGTIVDVLPYRPERSDLEIIPGGICPGFINSHMHLELSHLKGRIPEKTGLISFIQNIQKFRVSEKEFIDYSIQKAYSEIKNEGIIGFGDISNSSDSFPIKSQGDLLSHTFLECFSFLPDRALEIFDNGKKLKNRAMEFGLRSSITPHAPYSVSKNLFDKIREENEEFLSIHNQESEEENRLYQDGQGEFTQLYQSFGMDISFFKPYKKRSLPVYYPWLGSAKKLFVHNTFTKEEDLDSISGDKEYWCLCPGANLYIEGQLPNLEIFTKKFGRMLIGTDSLASNHQLSILQELKILQSHFPQLSLNQLLVWACRNGAEFFNWDSLGSFQKGKKPGVLQILNLDSEFQLNLNSSIRRIL